MERGRLGLVEPFLGDVEALEALVALCSVCAERGAPEPEVRTRVGEIAVGAVDGGSDVVGDRDEGVEAHVVADRPGRDHRDCGREGDDGEADPAGPRPIAHQEGERQDQQRREERALRAGEGAQTEYDSESRERCARRAVCGAECEQRGHGDEEGVGGLRHQHGVGLEEVRVDGGDRGSGQPHRVATDAAAHEADSEDGQRAYETEDQLLTVDGVDPGGVESREERGEERRVLGGRVLEAEELQVEGAQVAPALREVLADHVVRAGVAQLVWGLTDRRVDDDGEQDAHHESSHRDRAEPRREARGAAPCGGVAFRRGRGSGRGVQAAESSGTCHGDRVDTGAAVPSRFRVVRRAGRALQRDQFVVAGLIGVAFATRLLWSLHATRPITALGDPAIYGYLAERIVGGHGYTYVDGVATAYYPPGYPFALAGLQWLLERVGADLSTHVRMTMVNFVPSVLTVGLTWGIARRLFDRATAAVAAGIVAIWPNLVFFVAIGFTETLFLFLSMAALWTVIAVPWTPDALTSKRLAAFGALVAVSALVRPLTLPFLVLLPVALRVGGFPWRSCVWRAGVAASAAAVVLAPWAVRNTLAFDSPVLVSTNLGENLCIGRNPDAYGGYNLPAACTTGAEEKEAENDRADTIAAAKYAARHPLTEVRLAYRRAYYTYRDDHDGLSDTSGYLVPSGPGHRTYRYALAHSADAFAWSVVVLGLLALPRALRRFRCGDPRRAFLFMVAVWLAITPIVFFGQPRLKIPVAPMWAMGAAATLVAAARAVAARRAATPRP